MELLFTISLAMFFVAYGVLDCVVPHDLRWNRVGGLVHWRIGRLGGSFYVARRAR